MASDTELEDLIVASIRRILRAVDLHSRHLMEEHGITYRFTTEGGVEIEQVAEAMAAMKEFGFVGVMMGRFDILGITMVRNTEHLARFVHRHISGLEGVRRTESTLSVNFVKHDYRKSRIVA